MISEKTLRTLEFEKILEKIARYASSEPARAIAAGIRPLDSLERIESELDTVDEARAALFEFSVEPELGFDDISAQLDLSEKMSMLSMSDLLKIGRFFAVSDKLSRQLSKVGDARDLPYLKSVVKTFFRDEKLARDISESIRSETEMADAASPELRKIRSAMRKTSDDIKAKLNSYVADPAYSAILQDNIVTVRSNRYVIPVKSEFRVKMPGIVHDRSASGATLYVEPFAIVELNNALKERLAEEEREICGILRKFTRRVGEAAGLIRHTANAVARLDALFAKARYADEIDGVRPIFDGECDIDIVKGRHPLIPRDKVVPNDIRAGAGRNILVVTGPNTGGKTVCLKLVGLVEAMGLAGMFVPASRAKLMLPDDIYCDIGDEQSIEQCLSTFSSHMRNIVPIVDEMTDRSLVLLDELGAGTDPTEGASLALSIAEHIRRTGAIAVITTHYNEFKRYAASTDGVENAAMEFDPVTYAPTFRLRIGSPGSSNAIFIAEKLGLRQDVLERAKRNRTDDSAEFEKAIRALERTQIEANRKISEAETRLERAKAEEARLGEERAMLSERRERMNERARKIANGLVDEAMAEANEIVRRMREMLDNPTEQSVFEARKLRSALRKCAHAERNEFAVEPEPAGSELKVGDWAYMRSLAAEGEVIELDRAKGAVRVLLGNNIEYSAKLDDAIKLKDDARPAETRPKRTERRLRAEPVSPELMLIGMTTRDASGELTKYLDAANDAGLHEVRIVHGVGTGALREAVAEALRARSDILSFRPGARGEGGGGATVARFK